MRRVVIGSVSVEPPSADLLEWLMFAPKTVLATRCASQASGFAPPLPITACPPHQPPQALTSADDILAAVYLRNPRPTAEAFLAIFPHLRPSLQRLQHMDPNSFELPPPPPQAAPLLPQPSAGDGHSRPADPASTAPTAEPPMAEPPVTAADAEAVVRKVIDAFATDTATAPPVIRRFEAQTDDAFGFFRVTVKWPTTHPDGPPSLDIHVHTNEVIFLLRQNGVPSNEHVVCGATAAQIASTLKGLLYPVYEAPPLTEGVSDIVQQLEENGGYFVPAHTVAGRHADGQVDQSDKRSVTVVRGESGSGKTAFAVARLPGLIFTDGQEPILLYYRLQSDGLFSGTIATLQKEDETFSGLDDSRLLFDMRQQLDEWTAATAALPAASAGRLHASVPSTINAAVEEARNAIVSALRTRSEARDVLALQLMRDIFKKACEQAARKHPTALQSWLDNRARTPLPLVCLVVDEIGLALGLARGVASLQHLFYADMSPFAKRLEIVFVGTGSDSFQSTASDVQRPSTDPAKISMITIRPAERNAKAFDLLERILTKKLAVGGGTHRPAPPTEGTQAGERASASTLINAVKRLSVTNCLLTALVTHPRLTVLFGRELVKKEHGATIMNPTEGDVLSAARRAVAAFPSTNGLKACNTRRRLFSAAYGKIVAQSSVAVWANSVLNDGQVPRQYAFLAPRVATDASAFAYMHKALKAR